MQISLGVSGKPPEQTAKLVNPEVYDLYLRARALHRQRGAGLLQAIELFQQALAIDPEFAPAWAGLSHSYIVVPNYVSSNDWHRLGDVLEKSMAAAERALQLDPNLPTALHAMGNNPHFRYEWAKAEEFYLRALELDPDSADIMEDYVALLSASWRLEEAETVGARMVELDPHVPVFLMDMIVVYHAAGDFELRDQSIRAALDINPDLPTVQAQNLVRLLQYGLFDEARAYARVMSHTLAGPEEIRELIDWVSDPLPDPGPGVLDALARLTPIPAPRFTWKVCACRNTGAKWVGRTCANLSARVISSATEEQSASPSMIRFVRHHPGGRPQSQGCANAGSRNRLELRGRSRDSDPIYPAAYARPAESTLRAGKRPRLL